MYNAKSTVQLSPADRERLMVLVARLESAWQSGAESVDLGPYLPPTESALRLPYLRELIKTDLSMRWRRKRRWTLEKYLERFSELGTSADLPADLIYEEYRVRFLFGDRPEVACYRERFPEKFAEVQKLIAQAPLSSEYPSLPPPPPRASGATPAPPTHVTRTDHGSRLNTPLSLPSSPTEPILLNEGYTLEEKIGEGKFGVVYRAQAPGGIRVAVKIILQPLTQELARIELEALNRIRELRHPYLLQMHHYSAVDERLMIVMELADDSLADRLDACRKAGLPGIPTAELLAYFREAAEALDFLHAQKLMHRDIKPENLLRLKGHAKVADFGLVRQQEESMAQATMLGGTAPYMPPEGWRSRVSIHSDQYSLAITYAEMRLGRRVIRGSSLPEFMQEHIKGHPDLEGLEKAEQQVLRRALAKDPNQRFLSCRDFVAALTEAAQPKPRPAAPRPRRAILVAGMLVVGSLLGLILALLLKGPKETPARLPDVWLPPGCTKIKIREVEVREFGGKRLYTQVEHELPGADRLVFLLIPPTKEPPLPAFYILRDKVTRAQFAAMLAEPKMQQLLQGWQDKAGWAIKRAWDIKGLKERKRAKHPMLGITPTEAACFALALDGSLPTGKQWDKAGGGLDGKQYPCDERAWTMRPELEPVGNSKADTSMYGCTDMSGNGFEWVADVAPEGGNRFVPLANPTPDLRVEQRGQVWANPEKFRFDRILSSQQAPYGEASVETGFRVVLPVGD
jgi:serine/threonine protein kinase